MTTCLDLPIASVSETSPSILVEVRPVHDIDKSHLSGGVERPIAAGEAFDIPPSLQRETPEGAVKRTSKSQHGPNVSSPQRESRLTDFQSHRPRATRSYALSSCLSLLAGTSSSRSGVMSDGE